MEKDKKDKDPEIDEQYLISMMAGGVQKEGLTHDSKQPTGIEQKQEPKSKPKAKSKSSSNYEEQFLRNKNGSARSGKVVYIRSEFHERLSRIVQVIGKDKISIYEYMDNLLEHHFNEFGNDITQSFNDKYKPIL